MKHPLRLALAPWIAALVLSSAVSADSLTIPYGRAIVLDGTIDSTEWAGALYQELSGSGGSLRALHDGYFLYLGVTGDTLSFPHLAVMAPSSVWILHASAALGTVEYRLEDSGDWRRGKEFVWELRDTTMSDTAASERQAYLDQHGWVASTVGMGRPGHSEFKVDLELFDATPLRLAAVAGCNPDSLSYWPAGLDDGVRNRDLFLGNAPPSLKFNAARWSALRLGPLSKP